MTLRDPDACLDIFPLKFEFTSTGGSSGGMLSFSTEGFKKWLLVILTLFLIWQVRTIFSLDESEIFADEELDGISKSIYTTQQSSSPADSVPPGLAQYVKSTDIDRGETSHSDKNGVVSSLKSMSQSSKDDMVSSSSDDEGKFKSRVGCNLARGQLFFFKKRKKSSESIN